MSRAQKIVDRLVAIAEEDGFAAHAVHVLIDDESAEYHWSRDERRDVHSAAKGVCVLAIGIAADDGLLDVDEPVAAYLPDFPLGQGVEDVTVRHVLQMTSGIDFPWSETMMTDWPDLAAEFLSRPSRGPVFQYSNASTYTAMRALQSVVGDVPRWLDQRLFTPLAIDAPLWERCPNGWIVAGGGLHLRTAELARIGQLIRDGGMWQSQRVVSSRWVQAMHSDWFERGPEPEPAYRRYALSGWAGPNDAWRLHGAYGQLLIFLDNAVVTITAEDHFKADRMAERVVTTLEQWEADADT
ncbi:serine hydrolase [Cryobacterium sp. SO2]|uniref:serine hydrolase domain-containing protein n=1 Tax=Cryobacterium sp. SO2 TaxID=1897060 RepID=UPI00223E5FEA|nr:serine hydrolase [Cryobacterium sp. SO2]WEO76555.1 serine hydrolase [Cryobacterium sp. SO2]